MRSIDVAPLPLSDLESHLDEVAIRRLHDGVAAAHGLLDGRTVWTVTPSAAAEAGPAQTVAPLVGYARGLGIDARWLTLDAPAEFLAVTARLNAALHGSHGDGGKLADTQRDLYEHVLASNAENVVEDVREGDVVILHDPATAGLARAFSQAGATVIWRCHVGATDAGEEGQRAWAFLDRYLEDADLLVASRAEYLPPYAEEERDAVPFSREDGRPDAVRGLGDDAPSAPAAGTPVPEGTRVVTQVQRWDPLKGGLELVEAFASQIETLPSDAHLVLAGPTPDPAREPGAARTLEEITERVSTLPESVACRIHVLAIPASDREVNATIVNALQRVSAVVTQRSRGEAVGLTVAEARWKKAAVVGSAVGGIQDQIEDGVSGVLVAADDAAGWAEAVRDLLLLSERAREMGEVAHEAVRRDYLPDRHLIEVLNVIAQTAV